MTKMLASVSSPDEAEIALAGGADIIDLKDPSHGALAAVEPAIVREAVERVRGRRPVSAVAGDLPADADTVRVAVSAMAGTGVSFVKLGLPSGADQAALVRELAPLARDVRLVAVLFADAGPDLDLLPALAAAGFAGAMLDTAGKGGGGLLSHMPVPSLRRFVAGCRANGLLCGLAGSLEAPDIPRLLLLEPDLLGFRSALCVEGRAGPLDASRVALVRGLIPREGTAGLGVVGQGSDELARTDRIFVHDFTLPVQIGAYARERGLSQPVRFSVDAWVSRPARPAQDLRDVVSYDLISDGIRLLVDAGHVDLVETLADRIAGLMLGHARVTRVRVRLEKLETGSGTVGVEIERGREPTAREAALP